MGSAMGFVCKNGHTILYLFWEQLHMYMELMFISRRCKILGGAAFMVQNNGGKKDVSGAYLYF